MPQIINLTDPATGTQAQVSLTTGFNCFSWTVDDNGTPRDLLFAEPDFAGGQCRATGSGIPLMFPFAGRIAAAKFDWQGKSYQLPPRDQYGNALHGFAFDRPWRMTAQSADKVTAEFHTGTDAPESLAQWPSDHSIEVSYQVGPLSLTSHAKITNRGHVPLPCSFGWHPYFRLPVGQGGSTAETMLKIPTHQCVPLQQMLPTGTIEQLSATLPLDSGVRLGDRQFDEPFILDDSLGNDHVVELHDITSGRTLRQTFDASIPYVVVYTPGDRQSICVEPQTGPPDIYRMRESKLPQPMLLLAPGESRSYAMTLSWS